MIRPKNLAILAVVVVVLLGISVMQQARHRSATSRSTTEVLVPGELTADGLSRIEAGRGDQPQLVDLESAPDGWIVATGWNAAADRSRVDGLLRGLSGLRGEFRSDDAAVLADYGLDDAAAVSLHLVDKDGQDVVRLLVGRKPEGYPGNFVRKAGSNAVYLSETGILGLLGVYDETKAPQPRYFYDLQAVKENRLDIDAMVVDDDGATLDLVKEFAVVAPAEGDTLSSAEPDRSTWEWKLAGDDRIALAKTKVDAVLNSLVNIRAVDLADPAADPAAYGLAEPKRTARLVRADGSELRLEFGGQRPETEGVQAGTWLRVAGKPAVWVVTDYTVNGIFKSLDELKVE